MTLQGNKLPPPPLYIQCHLKVGLQQEEDGAAVRKKKKLNEGIVKLIEKELNVALPTIWKNIKQVTLIGRWSIWP